MNKLFLSTVVYKIHDCILFSVTSAIRPRACDSSSWVKHGVKRCIIGLIIVLSEVSNYVTYDSFVLLSVLINSRACARYIMSVLKTWRHWLKRWWMLFGLCWSYCLEVRRTTRTIHDSLKRRATVRTTLHSVLQNHPLKTWKFRQVIHFEHI